MIVENGSAFFMNCWFVSTANHMQHIYYKVWESLRILKGMKNVFLGSSDKYTTKKSLWRVCEISSDIRCQIGYAASYSFSFLSKASLKTHFTTTNIVDTVAVKTKTPFLPSNSWKNNLFFFVLYLLTFLVGPGVHCLHIFLFFYFFI